MSQQIQQTREVRSDGLSSTKTTKLVDDNNGRNDEERVSSSSMIARIVWFIAGVLIVLLALRFVLVLLGANPANGFANFIYSVSHPFVAPFFGLFGYNLRYGVSRFEASTLVAIVVYALIAFGIARLA